MNGASIVIGPVLAVVLVLLALLAAAVVWFGELGSTRVVLIAAVRAVTQLAAVSLVIVAILRSGWWTGLFVALMFTVASVTSARQIGGRVRRRGRRPRSVPGHCRC